MDYEKLPKEFQEWGRGIELEYVNTISDRAITFQAAEKEEGRTVSITEAEIFKPPGRERGNFHR